MANKKKKNPIQHLVAGGFAGFMESSICHPLDTIKTRMQLRRQANPVETLRAMGSMTEAAIRHSLTEPLTALQRSSLAEPALFHGKQTRTMIAANLHDPSLRLPIAPKLSPPPSPPVKALGTAVAAPLGPLGTAHRIIQREGVMALYKGLTAVYTGIVPKMAVRFVSFEQYRSFLHESTGGGPVIPSSVTFVAGLFSGLTEAILVVTPAEVCKIRMQGQYHSMMDPTQMSNRKYTNVIQTAYTIVREEGISALYKGILPTMLRQGCNQAVNFTMYQWFKSLVLERTNQTDLLPWQSLILGGVSGGFGPMVNNPLDVVKTRMQKQVVRPDTAPKYRGLIQSCVVIAKEEGPLSLWKGITPRLMRIVPGQAITFMTYEAISRRFFSDEKK
mmetsp:Transcript_25346/g.38957  ORF Transcript_25346/g.38957 Transcript_25346/m.38957 type:complete len:388 (-) Transcript_25346:163-1326(-)